MVQVNRIYLIFNRVQLLVDTYERFEEVCRTDKSFSIAEFARRINIDRSTVYNLFNQSSPDVHKLLRVSQALDHNFFCSACQRCRLNEKNKVVVGVEIDSDALQAVNLPDNFIRLQSIQPNTTKT